MSLLPVTNIGSWRKTRTCLQMQGALNALTLCCQEAVRIMPVWFSMLDETGFYAPSMAHNTLPCRPWQDISVFHVHNSTDSTQLRSALIESPLLLVACPRLTPLTLLVTIQLFVIKKRAGKYNKYTYRLLTILYKTPYSKYCMTLYASVCCDSRLCGLCLHYNTTTCIYSYMSRIYHYVSRLYIIEGYGLSHRLKCL